MDLCMVMGTTASITMQDTRLSMANGDGMKIIV